MDYQISHDLQIKFGVVVLFGGSTHCAIKRFNLFDGVFGIMKNYNWIYDLN